MTYNTVQHYQNCFFKRNTKLDKNLDRNIPRIPHLRRYTCSPCACAPEKMERAMPCLKAGGQNNASSQSRWSEQCFAAEQVDRVMFAAEQVDRIGVCYRAGGKSQCLDPELMDIPDVLLLSRWAEQCFVAEQMDGQQPNV